MQVSWNFPPFGMSTLSSTILVFIIIDSKGDKKSIRIG